MRFLVWTLPACVMAGLLLLSACAHAPAVTRADVPDANRAPDSEATVQDDVLSALDNIALARRLIRYARRNGAPQALAAAAVILSETPADLIDEDAWNRRSEGAAPDTLYHTTSLDPEKLLAEARAAAAKDPALVAWIDAESRRLPGRSRGALIKMTEEGRVSAGATDYFEVVFEEGEPAIVDINGAADVPLEVSVYDENARLIATDAFPSDGYRIMWTPAWRGPFTIVVRNIGRTSGSYSVAVN